MEKSGPEQIQLSVCLTSPNPWVRRTISGHACLRTRRNSPSIFLLHRSLRLSLPHLLLSRKSNTLISSHESRCRIVCLVEARGPRQICSCFCGLPASPDYHCAKRAAWECTGSPLLLQALWSDLMSSATSNLPFQYSCKENSIYNHRDKPHLYEDCGIQSPLKHLHHLHSCPRYTLNQ